MNKFFKAVIILALTGMTQVASSQGAGQFDQANVDKSIYNHDHRDDEYDRGERRFQWYSAGEARTNKVVNNEFTFRPRLNQRVDRIRLVGTGRGVIIRSVIVEYRNGMTHDLRELEGRLRQGERMAARLDGRFVRSVRVVATSESLVGSRGRFRVDLGVRNY